MSDPDMTARRFRLLALALGLALVLSLVLGLDYRVADWMYALGGGSWRLRRDPLFDGLLHDAVQRLCLLSYAAIVVASILCRVLPGRAALARTLGYVAVANTLCIALVSLGKAVLPIPCPWDLQRYGGALLPGGILDWQSSARVKGCFPSGHAVGGYAMFAWYFVAAATRPRWAPWVLAAAGMAGLGMGLVQQARGAHFVSHDLACALLCWLVAGTLAGFLSPTRPPRRADGRGSSGSSR